MDGAFHAGTEKRSSDLEHYLSLTCELKRLFLAPGQENCSKKEAEYLTEVGACDKPLSHGPLGPVANGLISCQLGHLNRFPGDCKFKNLPF